jgi:hypothetical protein
MLLALWPAVDDEIRVDPILTAQTAEDPDGNVRLAEDGEVTLSLSEDLV